LNYHAHLYFDAETIAQAASLRADLWERFGDDIKLYRLHSEPEGPHPCPSFGFAFTERSLASVTRWLDTRAAHLSSLVHPVIADDRAAHIDHGQWHGAPVDLRLGQLGPPPTREGHGVRFFCPTHAEQWGTSRARGPALAARLETQLDVDVFAIEGDGEVVGVVALGTYYPSGLEGGSLLEMTAIHQLLIAPAAQGCGWGHRALALALDYLGEFTDSARIYLGPVSKELAGPLGRRGFVLRGDRWRAPAPGTFTASDGAESD